MNTEIAIAKAKEILSELADRSFDIYECDDDIIEEIEEEITKIILK